MLAVSIKNLQQNTWKLLLPALLQKWAHICIEMQNLWKILILDEPWINFRLKLTMLKKSLLPARKWNQLSATHYRIKWM